MLSSVINAASRSRLRPDVERAAAEAKAGGAPFISFFAPEEMLPLAHTAGFQQARHISAATLAERYLADRTDSMPPPNNSEELVAMMRKIVLVSGPPGSGKSTIAVPIARALGFALLS